MTGKLAGIAVTAAAATHFSLSAPTNVSNGTAFNVIVTALDAYGNVDTGYRGRIHFTSTDHKANLPGDYTFTSAANGVHTFSVSLRSGGLRTITVTDTSAGAVTGSTQVNVS